MTTTVVHQSQPYTHGYVAAVPASTVQYHSTAPSVSERLNTAGAKTGGTIQLACAGLSVLLGIIAIVVESCKYFSGTPIWCGVMFYFPAGLLGIVAAKQKSSCPIIGCLVMSILAAIFSVIPFGVNLSGAFNEGDYYSCERYSPGGYYDYVSKNESGKIAVNIILTIVAVAEFATAIYTSVVMCNAASCCATTARTTVTVVSGQTVPAATTQVIQTGYPTGGYQPAPMQYGQLASGYHPNPPGYQPPAGYQAPPAGYQPPPTAYQSPPSGFYPPNNYPSADSPPNYSQTEEKK